MKMNKILEGILRTGRLANAYLFVGGSREEKLSAALDLAQRLNCHAQNACGICPACVKFSKGVHPDLMLIGRLEDKTKLSIDQMRQLKAQLHYGPAEGQYLTVVIKDADLMETAAANSVLKLLEEPPARVIIILLCEREDALPLTIHSRSQKIRFPDLEIKLNPREDLAWLYPELEKLADNKTPLYERLIFSQKLGKIKERTELLEIMYAALAWFWKEYRVKEARLVMEAAKQLKKNCQKKLALDVMCVKFGEICA